jgi:hypothetical protein
VPVTEWNADKILSDVERGTRNGFERAGKQLASKARSDLSTPYPPASRPGQRPRRRSGRLAGAQRHKITESGGQIEMTVGSPDVPYGAIVASKRPWLAVSPTEAMGTDIVGDEVRRALG